MRLWRNSKAAESHCENGSTIKPSLRINWTEPAKSQPEELGALSLDRAIRNRSSSSPRMYKVAYLSLKRVRKNKRQQKKIQEPKNRQVNRKRIRPNQLLKRFENMTFGIAIFGNV